MPEDKSEIQKPTIWPVLAGMRFLFCMWVLFAHTHNFTTAERAIPALPSNGLIAVICFFAISGFSIRHSIETQPEGYYLRRAARILPTHLAVMSAALAGFLAYRLLLGGGQSLSVPSPLDWLAYFTLMNVFIVPAGISFVTPLWSLSIEAIYYIFAPMFQRASDRLIVVIISLSGASVVVVALLTDVVVWTAPYGLEIFSFLWAWLAGWLAYSSRSTVPFGLFCAGVGCAAIWAGSPYFGMIGVNGQLWTYSAWIATMGVLFLKPSISMSAFAKRTMIYLGDLSFPLYVSHYTVLVALTIAVWRKYPMTNSGIVHVIVTVAVAHLLLMFIDKPFRRLGRTKHQRSIGAIDLVSVVGR